MNDAKAIPRSLAIAGSLMTLSIPVLYLIGYAYDQGYLNAYGINSEFFPRSFQDYLLNAFGVFMHIAMYALDVLQEKQGFLIAYGLGMATLTFLMMYVMQKNASKNQEAVQEAHGA